jgi:hypothetical protein
VAPRKLIVGGAAGAAALGLRAARSLRSRRRRAVTPELARIAEPAEPNPDVSAAEVAGLRDDLRRELERLASADVKASRSGLRAPPRG